MKAGTTGFMTVMILVLIGYIIFLRECTEPVSNTDTLHQQELKAKDQRIKDLEANSLYLLSKVDSLATLKQKVKLKIVEREREIDENIAKDSTNAIVEFRKSLQENNELPADTPDLTHREIGLSAKLMSRLPKLELTINLQEEQISNYKQIISNDKFTKESYKDIVKIKDLSIQDLQNRIDKSNNFFDDRIIVYMGIGASYDGTNLTPSLQFGLGFRIVTLWKDNK